MSAPAAAGDALAGARVVCLSPLPWSGLWTSRHEICQELAHRGVPVLFVDPPRNLLRRSRPATPRRAPANLTVATPPPYLPYGVLGGSPRLARASISRSARRYARFVEAAIPDDGRPLVVVNSFMPVLGWAVVGRLRGAVHVYHRADELRSFPSFRPLYAAYEDDVARSAHLVVCVSEEVRQGIANARPDAVVLRNGVDPARFDRAVPDARVAGLTAPVAVFVGRMDHRIDGAALDAVARVMTLVVAGPVDPGFRVPPAAISLGPVAPEEVPGLLAAADVALAPYTSFPGDPLKVYEYLAAGLPVVATRAPGLAGSPVADLIAFARSPEAFAAAAVDAAAADDPGAREWRRRRASEHSWARRVDELVELVAPLVAAAPGGSRR